MKSWIRGGAVVCGLAVLLVLGGACRGQEQGASGTRATLRLAVPQDRPANALVLQVTVGALAKGARVVLYGADGAVLGSVSPFGLQERRAGGTYTIPVPRSLVVDGALTVSSEVSGGPEGTHKPTEAEVQHVAIVRTEYPAER